MLPRTSKTMVYLLFFCSLYHVICFASSVPYPAEGSIYREYKQTMGGIKDWRVTDPESPQPGAKEFLPNSVLHISIDDLEGAIRAEALFDRWGGHTGTIGQKVRFNANPWIDLPMLTSTPKGHKPEAYQYQDNPVIEIPLDHLKQGDNSFQGTSGGQSCYDFNWGQWGWDCIVVRIYYDSSKSHVTGRIVSPKPGSILGENPTLSAEVSDNQKTKRVDFIGFYEGYDENGDGRFLDFHNGYFCKRDAAAIDITGHCATADAEPWKATWNTKYVPDQSAANMKLVARIQSTEGIWYVTDQVGSLSLLRKDETVRLYKAKNVPEKFWSRLNEVKSCDIYIPNNPPIQNATEATMHWRTWNGNEYKWMFGKYESTLAGGNHNFAYTICPLPAGYLKAGSNKVSVAADTEHHGVEVCYPGPALIVRYKKPSPSSRNIIFKHLSTKTNDLPIPNNGNQQTASQILDIDADGITDFVITERTKIPSVSWYKFNGKGFDKYIIDNTLLYIEAGGDTFDIDGDGDLDIHFCGDSREDSAWWWENPYPDYKPNVPWKRRLIKSGDDARYQHDSVFGDFDGDDRVELAWWSQTAKKLILAEIPDDPRTAKSWEYSVIFSGTKCEGIDKADINLDGKIDIVGAGFWFEHKQGKTFIPHKISDRHLVRCAAGQLIAGGHPEVVLGPGDGTGSLEWFHYDGKEWIAHRLKDFIDHGHSIGLADFDNDGNIDIFTAEMRLNNGNPDAKAWIFFNNGDGTFEEKVIVKAYGWHESRPFDLDGDGDTDILGKPYNWDAPRLDIWLNQTIK